MRLCILYTCTLGFLLALLPPSARGEFTAEKAVTDTLSTAQNCLECHSPTADLTRYGIDLGKIHPPTGRFDYRIDPDLFSESNHGALACRVCHVVGKEVYPHLKAAKEHYFDCSDCHDRPSEKQRYDVAKIEAEFQKSVHFDKMGDRFSCYSCHDPHVFDLAESSKEITQIIQDDNGVCLSCHDDVADFEVLTDRSFPVIQKSHSWLPNTELHWNAVRCVECHTPHTETFTHEILPGEFAEKRCVACHRTDSILLTTLYKYRTKEERSRVGFVNAAIFGESYVIGVTRNEFLDRWSVIILVLVGVGVVAHSLLRVVTSRWRARQ